MSKVILKGYLLVPDEDLAAVRRELPIHFELSKLEKGCLAFDVAFDTDNPNRINIYEEFRDKEAFDFHNARMAGSDWKKTARNVESHIQITGLD